MPGLTIATDIKPPTAQGAHFSGGGASNSPPLRNQSRTSSPTRPPISPITPTLGPTRLSGGPPLQLPPPGVNNTTSLSSQIPTSSKQSQPITTTATGLHNVPSFAQDRKLFTHSQPDQVAAALPPFAGPIAFDDNPDVLALKSAISILQLQRQRAQADMQALSRAKTAALARPEEFMADLVSGRISNIGDPLTNPDFGLGKAADDDDDHDDSDEGMGGNRSSSPSSSSSSGEEGDDDKVKQEEGESRDGDVPMTSSHGADRSSSSSSSSSSSTSSPNPTTKGKRKRKDDRPQAAPGGQAAWRKLPKPQTVVRCPPVNWAQYGVIGESLDKLHAEQIAAPSLGAPVVLGPGGALDPSNIARMSGGDRSSVESVQSRRLVGIAAPYDPLRDNLVDKKPKGGGR